VSIRDLMDPVDVYHEWCEDRGLDPAGGHEDAWQAELDRNYADWCAGRQA
jgi:hypothetical protein